MASLEDLYESNIDKLFSFCLYKTGSRRDAEDLASDSFMKFLSHDGMSKDNPQAYLWTIARNAVTDYYRTRHPQVSWETLLEQGRDLVTSFDPVRLVLVKEMYESIERLPEDQRDVLLMQYVQDLDNETIAQALGKSEGAVKSLAHRGVESLRAEYKEKGTI